LRIAGQFQHEGGWVDEPAADLKNVNDSNLTDVRLEALWQATPYFKTLLTQAIHRENYGIGLGENAAGDVIPVYGVTFTPNGEQSFSLSNLTVTAELPAVQLLSSSSYLTHSEENSNLSYVFGTEVELQKYLPISNRTFSEELRLHNTSRSTWHWTLGAFYQHYQDSNSALEYVGLA